MGWWLGRIDTPKPILMFLVRWLRAPNSTSGFSSDTWVYGMAFKDYKITAAAEGATVTAYVRQMPGPTQPPSGDWSDENISWIKNRVTPYQWQR